MSFPQTPNQLSFLRKCSCSWAFCRMPWFPQHEHYVNAEGLVCPSFCLDSLTEEAGLSGSLITNGKSGGQCTGNCCRKLDEGMTTLPTKLDTVFLKEDCQYKAYTSLTGSQEKMAFWWSITLSNYKNVQENNRIHKFKMELPDAVSFQVTRYWDRKHDNKGKVLLKLHKQFGHASWRPYTERLFKWFHCRRQIPNVGIIMKVKSGNRCDWKTALDWALMTKNPMHDMLGSPSWCSGRTQICLQFSLISRQL